MPFSIEPADKKLLAVVGAAFVAISLFDALLAPPETNRIGYPSSYSTEAGGAEAAYLLLGNLGCRMERWSKPPQELPANASNTVLVLAAPYLPASEDEKFALQSFVERGGRVLATGALGAGILGVNNLKPARLFNVRPDGFDAELPDGLTRGAPNIRMYSPMRWPQTLAWQIRSYGDEYGAAVVSYRLGRGEVVWWAGATPLTNSGLKQASNLAFFLNTVSVSSRPRILWDEYFHGARQDLWAYIGSTPLPWGLVQAGLILLALIITFSRRSGPICPLVKPSRLAPLEFVETLGDLYQRKHAARTALEISYQRFRLRLQSRFGIGASIPAEKVPAGVRAPIEWNAPGLWRTIELCDQSLRTGTITEPEALGLIQALNDGAAKLGLAGEFTGGKIAWAEKPRTFASTLRAS